MDAIGGGFMTGSDEVNIRASRLGTDGKSWAVLVSNLSTEYSNNVNVQVICADLGTGP
jgi:hypothetical protein